MRPKAVDEHIVVSMVSNKQNSTASKFVSPSPCLEKGLDADHNHDAPLLFRNMDNIIGLAYVLGIAQGELAPSSENLLFTSIDELISFIKVEKHHFWRVEMLEEMKPIKDNGWYVEII